MVGLFFSRLLLMLLCLVMVSSSQPPAVTAAELEDHYVDRLGMTISLPAEVYITGRTVRADYEPLEILGVTASQLEVEFKKGNIYCAAVWFPESTDMTEIVVTMTEDDDSGAIFQLKDYDRTYTQALADSYASFVQNGLEVSARYTEASVVDTEQAVFIRALGVMESQEASENHLHYMTVVNGMRIEITLVEHYSAAGKTAQSQRVTPENELIMDSVIDSIRFDKLENEFVAKNRGYVICACVIALMCVGLAVSYIMSKIKAYGTPAADYAEPYVDIPAEQDTDSENEKDVEPE